MFWRKHHLQGAYTIVVETSVFCVLLVWRVQQARHNKWRHDPLQIRKKQMLYLSYKQINCKQHQTILLFCNHILNSLCFNNISVRSLKMAVVPKHVPTD
jgi:hypothetical protein